MKKWILAVMTVSITLLCSLTVFQCRREWDALEYPGFVQLSDRGYVYIGQNGKDGGCLVKLSRDGETDKMFLTERAPGLRDMHLEKMVYAQQLYCLFQKEDDYRVAVLSDELELKELYTCNDFRESIAGGLDVPAGKICVTMLADGNTKAVVYELDTSAEEKRFRMVLAETAENGRYFVETAYDGEKITARLDDGTDTRNAVGKETFSIKDKARVKIILALREKTIVQNFLCGIGFTLVMMLLAAAFWGSRSYGIQRFVLAQSLLLLILAGNMGIHYVTAVKSMKEDRMRYALWQAEELLQKTEAVFRLPSAYPDFYDSPLYHQTLNEIGSFLDKGDRGYALKDAVIVKKTDAGFVEEVSTAGYGGRPVKEAGPFGIDALLQYAWEEGGTQQGYLYGDGQESGALAVVCPWQAVPERMLLVQVSLEEMTELSGWYLKDLCLLSVVLWLTGTLLIGCISYLEYRSMRILSGTMEAVCRGKVCEWKRPAVRNADFERMWNSLSELCKSRERMNYSRNLIYQAYYRFAPKNVERFLGKDSIADVRVGDMVRMNSAIAMVFPGGREKPGRRMPMNDFSRDFETVCRFQMQEGGVLLPGDCNLNVLKILFGQDIKAGSRFGIETLLALSEDRDNEKQDMFILLHAADMYYGITGTEEQAYPFLISAEVDALAAYADSFRQLNIRMAVTESAAAGIGGGAALRYIGYVELETSGRNLKIYESLDACPSEEKWLRLETEELFEKAMELYYKSDFYLARNAFTEVIKICPSDQVARWYLFTCEDMLNRTSAECFHYGLFSGNGLPGCIREGGQSI